MHFGRELFFCFLCHALWELNASWRNDVYYACQRKSFHIFCLGFLGCTIARDRESGGPVSEALGLGQTLMKSFVKNFCALEISTLQWARKRAWGQSSATAADIRLFLPRRRLHCQKSVPFVFFRQRKTTRANGINFVIAVAGTFDVHSEIIYLNKHLVF